MVKYSYDRTSKAKKPVATPGERVVTPGERVVTERSEVEKAVAALREAIEALHNCAPSGRDFQKDGVFDSKSYNRAVTRHGARIDALYAMISDLTPLLDE
jgi:hypothetical protein